MYRDSSLLSHFCISQLTNDAHRCPSYICHGFIFFGDVPVQIFYLIFNWVFPFSYCWVLKVHCMFWMSLLSDVSFADIFSPVWGWYFHSLGIVFCTAEIFGFSKVQLINCFFHGLCLWCCIWKITVIPKVI